MPESDAPMLVASGLMPEIYSAALDPTCWESVIDRIRLAVGAQAGVLAVTFVRTRESSVLASTGFPKELLTRWEARRATSPWGVLANELPEGSVLVGSEIGVTEEMRASWLWREVLAPRGLRDMVGVIVIRRPLVVGHLSFWAERELGAPERTLLQVLSPHLVRVTALHRRLAWFAEGAGVFAGGIDAVPHGLFLVDARGVVVHANRAAHGILDERDGLLLQDGRLVASRTDDAQALERAIAAVTQPVARSSLPELVEMAVSVRRPSGRRAYHLLATPSRPLPAARASMSASGPLGLVWVNDPERRVVPSAAVVGRLLGLTPAEARLAAGIAEGLTVREYARRAGVQESTARTTLKQVLEKTGTHRQVELVRLILSGIPGALGEEPER